MFNATKGKQMDLMIVNQTSQRTTRYTPSQLVKDARWAVKGKGKFVGYFVTIQEGAPSGAVAVLVAEYRTADGMIAQTTVAI
jgi:hypothetical protein